MLKGLIDDYKTAGGGGGGGTNRGTKARKISRRIRTFPLANFEF